MLRLGFIAALFVSVSVFAADPPATKKENNEGVQPVGADGKPLNLDFETGTLKDWTAEGEAFKNQPIKGDTVAPRRGDMRSRHQGQYWIGGYERTGDKPTGTLTSVPFKVTHRWASFLVGGGPWKETRVELLHDNQTFHTASGMEEEDMRREVIDLVKFIDKEIQVRVVDAHTGHWGHVNFDDFRFHQNKPTFPARPKNAGPGPVDVIKNAGLSPEKAAMAMTVPEGFTVSLFAGEPDVHQPVAFCIDDRGRLWVAEAYVYPKRIPVAGAVLPENQRKNGDRILIFEDVDGDGKFDKRTTFIEGLNLVSGIEVGFGGVWVGAAPYFMFIPDKNGDDQPDGPPQILLDGWGYQDTHETLNAFNWGPDGWLYGCHGVFAHSLVGKPDTPEPDRIKINAGIWRYHPTRHVFEVFSHGTSNPWGLDYNDVGDWFIEACVIPHCFHMIQGGRYHRQGGIHFNLHTYDDIKTIADHFHYLGANPHGGNNRSDAAGGGHAHCGLMCYLGGAWPEEYRGQLFMGNIHGKRINVDLLRPKGSGYVASHGKDFLLANDDWARFINLKYGPDGNVFLIDWYDKQACHRNEPEIWDRTNGRIYKVSYRGAKPVKDVNLQKLSTRELIALQTHENDWYVRHARRILQERFAQGDLTFFNANTLPDADKLAFESKDERHRLRGLWLFHVHGQLTNDRIKKWLADPSAHVRAWAIQCAAEDPKLHEKLQPILEEMAEKDLSPVVRRYIASAAQRMAPEMRWQIVRNLIGHANDASDPNLPLLAWYAAEPLAQVDADRALHTSSHSELPQTLTFMSRRIASMGTLEALDVIAGRLAKTDRADRQRALLEGLQVGLGGQRQVAMPKSWAQASARLLASSDAAVQSLAKSLNVTFGDPKAFSELRAVLISKGADSARLSALTTLLSAKDKDLPPILHRLLAEPALRAAALKGLAVYDDASTPAAILAVYSSLNSDEKRDALNTLASRSTYAKEMLAAITAKKIATSDVTADIVRAMQNLNDTAIEKEIAAVWGIARKTPAERLKLIAETKKALLAKGPAPDLMLGRAMFQKTCAQCHTLYGVGGKISPDLTGSNRANLDYLLENVLDPSGVIAKEYAVTVFDLDSGRKVTGIVKQETDAAVTVQTANELLTLPKKEIESRKPSDVSMMPDDILKTLKPGEFRALIAYLQHPQQVPLLATEENAKDLFNGKDLSGWDGNAKLWSVENGEIVGKSPGLKRNEFLMSHMAAENFRLTLKIKLTPNRENSGIQFRSEPLPSGEMRGYQADAGQGWWGKLYEESGRALLWDKSGEEHVKKDDWNDYEIVAVGSRIRTFINGKPCVNLDDPKGAKRGIFGLQIHSGGPMEVRFKDLKLEVNPK